MNSSKTSPYKLSDDRDQIQDIVTAEYRQKSQTSPQLWQSIQKKLGNSAFENSPRRRNLASSRETEQGKDISSENRAQSKMHSPKGLYGRSKELLLGGCKIFHRVYLFCLKGTKTIASWPARSANDQYLDELARRNPKGLEKLISAYRDMGDEIVTKYGFSKYLPQAIREKYDISPDEI